MELTIGFSPCPNDTFIFDALINGGIDTGSFRFKPVLEDVQTLNEWALQGKLDITKLSYNAWFSVKNEYTLLQAGSALGKGVGPLLISREHIPNIEEHIASMDIAIPGWHTTAHMLLRSAGRVVDRDSEVGKIGGDRKPQPVGREGHGGHDPARQGELLDDLPRA